MTISFQKLSKPITIALLSSVLCLILCFILPPFPNDFNYFSSWGQYILDHGIWHIYDLEIANEYPPIYLLICSILSLTSNTLKLNSYSEAILFRIPSIIIYFCSILIFFQLIKAFLKDNKKNYFIIFLMAFSPAIIIDIIWAQADTFLVFFGLLTVLFIIKERTFFCLLSCTLALLTKPQFLFFIPIIFLYIFFQCYKNKTIKKLLINLSVCFLIFIFVYIPFIILKPGKIFYIFTIFYKQISHSSYFSVNAFNLYYLIGLNSVKTPYFYNFINLLVLIIIFLFCLHFLIKNHNVTNTILIATYMVIAINMLSIKIHERYMLYTLGSMLILTTKIGTKNFRIINLTFYFTQFFNILFVYIQYILPKFWKSFELYFILIGICISLINNISFIFLTLEIIKYNKPYNIQTN